TSKTRTDCRKPSFSAVLERWRKEHIMASHRIVSQETWFEAHKAHLAREKELTRLRDKIAAERRELPWLKVKKDYVFETERGPEKLTDLFKGNSQLVVYHFMMAPGST